MQHTNLSDEMLKSFNHLTAVLGLLLALGACADEAPVERTVEAATAQQATEATVSYTAYAAGTQLTPWVDRLTVRDAPSSSGKRIGSVSAGDLLIATGSYGNDTEAVLLRGGLYETPFVEVTLADETQGYVYAGGVRELDAQQPEYSTDELTIAVPRFGTYRLREWRELSHIDVSEPEMDASTRIYRLAQRKLEDYRYSLGEMGYGRSLRLMSMDGEVLREYNFRWNNDGGGPSKLEELVVMHDSSPPRAYARKQQTSAHFAQLGGQPTRVVGEWEEVPLPAPTSNTEGGEASGFAADQLQGEWRSIEDEQSELLITAREFVYRHSGSSGLDARTYRQASFCPEEAGGYQEATDEPQRYLVLGNDEQCLYIVALSSDSLTLSNVGRGNTLHYVKAGQ